MNGPVSVALSERLNLLKEFLINWGPDSDKGKNARHYVTMYEGCSYLVAIGDNDFPTPSRIMLSLTSITRALNIGIAIGSLKGAIWGFCFPEHAVAFNGPHKMAEHFSPDSISRFATNLKELLPSTTTAAVFNYVLQDPLPPEQNRIVVALLDKAFGIASTTVALGTAPDASTKARPN